MCLDMPLSVGRVWVITAQYRKRQNLRGEDVIEVVDKFCYLGDMPSSCGGESEAVSARIDKSLESLGS